MVKETTIKVRTDTRDKLMIIKIKTKAKNLDSVITKNLIELKRIKKTSELNGGETSA